MIGQEHILGNNKFLSILVKSKQLVSLILWGSPGVGKTTIARILADECLYNFISVSAMFSGISEVKDILKKAESDLDQGKQTVLFIDEIHRFNIKQQDVLLPILENGTVILIGATTENPSFYLNKALLSRCQVLELKNLVREDFIKLKKRAECYLYKKFELNEQILDYIISYSYGDGRYFLNILEIINIKYKEEKIIIPSFNEIKTLIRKRATIYDKSKDEHFNLISALHKSIRGSDEQASLYWFNRMVEGGEDLNYIARRLLRIAAEDIGLADPSSLGFVVSAWQSYERLGSPEGILMLAEAVIYLALSPKSNAVYKANLKANDLAKKTSNVKPPKHILPLENEFMREFGYGEGYVYDHDTENNFSGQNYFPDKMQRQQFYDPKNIGYEKELKKRINYFNKLRQK